MRPRRILDVARRDLRLEFSGRQAWFLPIVAAVLLLPFATAPGIERTTQPTWISVTGDVPEDVLAIPEVSYREGRAHLVFEPHDDPEAPRRIRTHKVPPQVRKVLDATDTRVNASALPGWDLQPPARSLFIALLAASMLTGSLAQSIPGERTSRTLEVLLTTSLTRTEITLGKWVAWGGYGAFIATAATVVSLLLGRQDLGLWALSVPWVPLGTAALGFWMVRRANDVVGGATVVIRLLPALLAGLGLLAWWLGRSSPWLGASIPFGGALAAAGVAWDSPGPMIWAPLVTAAASVGILAATARDLEAAPHASRSAGVSGALLVGGLATAGWWTAILASWIWVYGGAAARTEVVSPEAGILAGLLSLVALLLIQATRAPDVRDAFGWRVPPATAWVLAAGAAVVLGASAGLADVAPVFVNTATRFAHERLGAAVTPIFGGVLLTTLVVLAQESLFRGWILREGGAVVSILLWTLFVDPTDPVAGLASGTLLVLLTRLAGGSVLPALLARAIAAAWPLPLLLDGPTAVVVMVGGLVVLGALWARRTHAGRTAAAAA